MNKVKLGGNFYGAVSYSTLQSYTGDITAPLYSIMTAPTNIPVYNADGSYYKYLGKNNALANLLEPTNDLTQPLINANMYLDYDIVKNLTYHIDGGVRIFTNHCWAIYTNNFSCRPGKQWHCRRTDV